MTNFSGELILSTPLSGRFYGLGWSSWGIQRSVFAYLIGRDPSTRPPPPPRPNDWHLRRLEDKDSWEFVGGFLNQGMHHLQEGIFALALEMLILKSEFSRRIFAVSYLLHIQGFQRKMLSPWLYFNLSLVYCLIYHC